MDKINISDLKKLFPAITRGLSKDEIEHLLDAMETVQVDKGSIILDYDKPNDRLYLLIKGTLTSYIMTGEEKITLGPIKPGQLAGEVSMLDAETPSASVIADTDAVFLMLSRDEFFKLDKSYPNITGHLLHIISQHLGSRIQNGEALLYEKLLPGQPGTAPEDELNPVEWAKKIYQKLHTIREVH